MRLGECDLRCTWCDSVETWRPARTCRIEEAPGSGRFATRPNPVDLATLGEVFDGLGGPPGSFVSLTGGEPLLQPDAVAFLARLAREGGRLAYLETHGLAVEALEKVVEEIDVVSMDWKLESDVRRASGSAPFAPEHARFLALARKAPGVVVKVVVTPRTTDPELDEVARAMAEIAPDVPLVLQPVTPMGPIRATPSAEQLLAWQRACSRRLRDVRIIPQTHRAYGAL